MSAKVNKSDKKSGGGGGGKSKSGGGKDSGGGGGGSSKSADNSMLFKREEALQAVLLADSFKVKFRPITLQKPKVLLPLVNVPMIDYTLEFLVSGGVREIFVFCCAHAAAIEAYINQSKWSAGAPQFTVRTIVSENCFSPGDALRHLDTLGLITGDFVLVSGDVISNIKLEKVLAAHKARVAADKRNIMTMIFKKAAPKHRTRTLDDDLVTAINQQSGQLLLYENNLRSKKVNLDVAAFDEHASVAFRMDLMDARIYICSPEVLLLLTENFDQQDLDEFVRGVLAEDILGNKIFTHVISGEYAARVDDLFTYDSVSKDVIRRWTYPIVPDNNFLSRTTYTFARGNIYKEKNINLARSCMIGEDTVIGAGTEVGALSVIRQSVIGRDCKIGSNVTITGSYLLGACTVEDGCVIDRAILCDGVIVRHNAIVEKGCVLSYKTVIGNGFRVPAQSKLIALTKTQEAEINDNQLAAAAAAGGDDSDGEGEGDGASGEGKPKKGNGKSTSSSSSGAVASAPGGASTGIWSVQEVGVGGVGRVYVDTQSEQEKDDEDASASGAAAKRIVVVNSLAPDPILPEPEEDDWLIDFQDDDLRSNGGRGDGDGSGNGSGEDDEHDLSGDEKSGSNGASGGMDKHERGRLQFFREAIETLRRGNEENLDPDAIVLEMSSLKLSHDASVQDYARGTIAALLAFAGVTPTEEVRAALIKDRKAAAAAVATAAAAAAKSGAAAAVAVASPAKPATAAAAALTKAEHKSVVDRLHKVVKKWALVLIKFGKAKNDQILFIQGWEALCASDDARYGPFFPDVLQLLYDYDVLTEPAILGWEKLKLAPTTPAEEKRYFLKAAPFLKWLKEAEEEDDDDDDGEDDDD